MTGGKIYCHTNPTLLARPQNSAVNYLQTAAIADDPSQDGQLTMDLQTGKISQSNLSKSGYPSS